MGRNLAQVVLTVSLFGISLSAIGCHNPAETSDRRNITDVKQGDYKVYEESVGDTWDPGWADDDNIYAASDDTSGWSEGASRDICFIRMVGDDWRNAL